MNKYGTEFSKRVSDILSLYTGYTDPIEETKKILYEMLEPTPDRGDMLYRYEHCIRTAENARRIADRTSVV